ncbi:MAG: lactate racemase domain-containing protein [Chthoniobacterales bacterium]
MDVVHQIAPQGSSLTNEDVERIVAEACAGSDFHGKRVLVIVPDSTRTAPIGPVFKALYKTIGGEAAAFNVMIALGTHQPMPDGAICKRLEITAAERTSTYGRVQFFNHEWDNPQTLKNIGTIPASEIEELSGGLFSMDVEVKINKHLYDYDRIIIIGPVFPHEVVGCSGGNKYLFPGVSGPEVLNFFHWLGAVVTNPMIIGNKMTPVRKVVDRAAKMVPIEKLCFCLVVDGKNFAGMFAGTPEASWDLASDLSQKLHIAYTDRPYHTVLSRAPEMYDELWVGGKCMYKLEPVVADGGELIIYAPHIHEISLTHGRLIREIGYHCRDYFLKQWDKFSHYPWGTIAHSTHVRGIGTYENGVEKCRVKVTLATGIPEEICKEINLGYRDPASIRVEDYEGREDEGILYVPKAGEMLYHLKERPAWAAAS